MSEIGIYIISDKKIFLTSSFGQSLYTPFLFLPNATRFLQGMGLVG
jgi:hypothetical protein